MAAGHRGAARGVLTAASTAAGSERVNGGESDMRDTSLLQLALGVAPPWTVVRSDFDTVARRLDIYIDFTADSRFTCPSCGAADCPAHDTEQMKWRHLNFFQHQTYLYAPMCHVCAASGAGSRRSACPRSSPGAG
jgi:transposase